MNSNTPAPKLSDDVINQIKDFPKPNYLGDLPFYDHLTEKQKKNFYSFCRTDLSGDH